MVRHKHTTYLPRLTVHTADQPYTKSKQGYNIQYTCSQAEQVHTPHGITEHSGNEHHWTCWTRSEQFGFVLYIGVSINSYCWSVILFWIEQVFFLFECCFPETRLGAGSSPGPRAPHWKTSVVGTAFSDHQKHRGILGQDVRERWRDQCNGIALLNYEDVWQANPCTDDSTISVTEATLGRSEEESWLHAFRQEQDQENGVCLAPSYCLRLLWWCHMGWQKFTAAIKARGQCLWKWAKSSHKGQSQTMQWRYMFG